MNEYCFLCLFFTIFGEILLHIGELKENEVKKMGAP